MKILVTGASGQLGQAFLDSQLPAGFSIIAASKSRLNLTDAAAVHAFIERTRPDLVINCAAYTLVDKAERDRDLAYAINRDGAGLLAKATAKLNIPIVHISTDYVFDGKNQLSWCETDDTNPVNEYGRSKRDGEIAIKTENKRHIIIRTSWLYSAYGANFLLTMLRIARKREALNVVNDQFSRPTSAFDLTHHILQMAIQTIDSDDRWGIYHLSNSGAPTSWYGFACEIFRIGASWLGPPPVIRPITTVDFNAAAARPQNSLLDMKKVETIFHIRPRIWQAALADTMDQLRLEAKEIATS